MSKLRARRLQAAAESPLRSALYSADQMERHGEALARAHKLRPGRTQDLLLRPGPKTKASWWQPAICSGPPPAENTEVSLNVHATAERILIDVEDQCGGLPLGDVEKMFVPFTQGGSDKSGLGLGLAICRRSVEANSGVLSVRNIPGSGCVFTIELPRHAIA